MAPRTIRDRTRLFLWQLVRLLERMKTEGSPYADDLSAILARYTNDSAADEVTR